MYRETKSRSFAKAISNRVVNTLATMMLVLIFTGKIETALTVGGIEIIIKFILYYLNERAWDKIRFGRKEYKPFAIWFTGLPLAGKKMLASEIEARLQERQLTVQRLDGDDVRTLFPLQGFNRKERDVYLMRMGYFTRMLLNNGVFVIASFISPYTKSREYNRRQIKDYFEVYVATPIEKCREMDEWNLYERAEKGELQNFIGVHENYEAPKNPDVVVDLSKQSVLQAVDLIMNSVNLRLKM